MGQELTLIGRGKEKETRTGNEYKKRMTRMKRKKDKKKKEIAREEKEDMKRR